jgi:nicotinamidase-related amidase
MIEIAARPFPFRFDPARTALVVIDMQRDFLEPGGFGESLGNDLAPVAEIVPTVAALIQTFRNKGWTILHTRESRGPPSSSPARRRLARS